MPLPLGLDPDTPPNNLPDLIEYVVHRQYGGIRRRLAESMGVSLSYLGKCVNHQWPMGPENLLKVAKIAGLSPTYCLKVGGHGDLAELIIEAYGRESRPRSAQPLDDQQRQLLLSYAHLSARQRQALLEFVETLRSPL